MQDALYRDQDALSRSLISFYRGPKKVLNESIFCGASWGFSSLTNTFSFNFILILIVFCQVKISYLAGEMTHN